METDVLVHLLTQGNCWAPHFPSSCQIFFGFSELCVHGFMVKGINSCISPVSLRLEVVRNRYRFLFVFMGSPTSHQSFLCLPVFRPAAMSGLHQTHRSNSFSLDSGQFYSCVNSVPIINPYSTVGFFLGLNPYEFKWIVFFLYQP